MSTIPGIKGPTLKQIYHAYMDTMRDGRDEISKQVQKTDVDMDWIFCDMITCILEIPGVSEAVVVAALKLDTSTGYVGLTNSERVGDVPFQFVWDWIMNPEDLGIEEKE